MGAESDACKDLEWGRWARSRRAALSLNCEATEPHAGCPGPQGDSYYATARPCPQARHHGVGLSATPPATHTGAPGGGAFICPASRPRPVQPALASSESFRCGPGTARGPEHLPSCLLASWGLPRGYFATILTRC